MRDRETGRRNTADDPTGRPDRCKISGNPRSRRAALFVSICLWPSVAATAQDRPPAGAPSPRLPDGEAVTVGDDREIVVTARFGEALVEPEAELDEQQIDAYGAYSIGELVRRVAPLTGRPDEPPIILVNGERVDSIQDLASFPPAALQRLAVLPPEAAGRYGFAGNQRVVNLVLKKHFVSWETQVGVKLPTAGGRIGGNGSAGRFVIDGKARWNAQVQLSGESALFRSSRAPSSRTDDLVDPDDYLSLLPATNQLAVSMGIARPLGRFTGSVSVNAATSGSRQWLGLASADPGSANRSVLLSRQSSQSLALSGTLSGPLTGGRAIFGVNYARNWADGRIDQPDETPVDGLRTSRNRSVSESLSARLTFNRSIASLPAGPLTATLTAGANRNRTTNRFSDGLIDEDRVGRVGRDRFDGRLSLAVPIASRSENPHSPLGDLSLDLAGGLTFGPREASRERLEMGVNWSTVPAFRINGSLSYTRLAPSIEQLTAPDLEEVRRVYDFARQEIAEPVWVTGGNPDLGSGQRRTWALGATLRPFDPRLLSLSVEYQKQQSTGGAGGFPGLSPAVEAAIPDRFVRDASGHLIRVDARPIRIERDTTERLNNSLTLSLLPRVGNKRDAAGAVDPANLWNLSLSLNHGWSLRSELVTAAGLPPIDRLRGGTAQSRHNVGFQIVAGRPGLGAIVDGNWQSAFRLPGSSAEGGARDYRYKAAMTLNLRLFAEAERLLHMKGKPAWFSKLNVSLDIQNLFNGYRRVTLADGRAAPGYERYEADPLGRTVQLSLRKRF